MWRKNPIDPSETDVTAVRAWCTAAAFVASRGHSRGFVVGVIVIPIVWRDSFARRPWENSRAKIFKVVTGKKKKQPVQNETGARDNTDDRPAPVSLLNGVLSVEHCGGAHVIILLLSPPPPPPRRRHRLRRAAPLYGSEASADACHVRLRAARGAARGPRAHAHPSTRVRRDDFRRRRRRPQPWSRWPGSRCSRGLAAYVYRLIAYRMHTESSAVCNER